MDSFAFSANENDAAFTTLHSFVHMQRQASSFEQEVLSGKYAELVRCSIEVRRDELIRRSGLSPREKEVFRAFSMGKPSKQVAFELSASEITVKIQAASVRKKLSKTLSCKIDTAIKMALVYWGTDPSVFADEPKVRSSKDAPVRFIGHPTSRPL